MFERAHHRNVALVLQALDPQALAQRNCWFGGGTAMALRFGEYRESVDIDFMVSDLGGYRELRQVLGGPKGLEAITRKGLHVDLARDVRADQYGIRTQVRSGDSVIKFEIVLEARIELATPGKGDAVCGVLSLAPVDLAAEKLLANADRWPDDSVYSRDLIDLALQPTTKALLESACGKAETAYGTSIRASIAKATDMLRRRPNRIEACMKALQITGVTKAQLWQSIRRIEKMLPAPGDVTPPAAPPPASSPRRGRTRP